MSGLTILTGNPCRTAIGYEAFNLTVFRFPPVALSLTGLSLVAPRAFLVR
jgi:hypothetical protein